LSHSFVRPACALVAGDEEGIWPHPLSHPRSPSLASLAGDEEGRLSPAASLAASGSGFSRLFLSRVCPSFFSHRFMLMPFPALSQVHNGPLSLANTSGGVDLAVTAARRRSSLFGSVSFLSLVLFVLTASPSLAGARRLCPLSVCLIGAPSTPQTVWHILA